MVHNKSDILHQVHMFPDVQIYPTSKIENITKSEVKHIR